MSRGRDAGEHRLGLTCGDIAFGLSRKEFGQQRLESVDGLDPAPGQCFAAIGEDPQCLELAVDLQDPEVVGADRDDRDRVRIARVGLAVVAGVEEPDASSELGRHVDDVFAGFEESLGQWATCPVGSLDGPDPVRPGLRKGPHRRVAGPVGGEPPRPQESFIAVDDLDRRGQLVGIDPDDHLLHASLPPALVPIGRRGGQCYYEQGSPLWSHASSAVPGGLQTESEPHPHASGQPN